MAAAIVLLGAAGAAFAGLLLPMDGFAQWTTVAGLLTGTATLAALTTPGLLATPPASRRARRWLANGHQACAILLIGLGVRAIDRWWHTPPADRTWLALGLIALGSLGYLSVRLGMTARFLRPGPEFRPPPDPR